MLLLCVLLALWNGAHALVGIGTTALVFNEDDLREALEGSFTNIEVRVSMKLTEAYWAARQPLYVNKTVTLSAYQYFDGALIIDASNLTKRCIICVDESCRLTLLGPFRIINFAGPPIDFATPLPAFIGASYNGTLVVRNVDVVSIVPTGLWYASSMLYNVSNSWWVGRLNMTCENPVDLEIDWFTENEPRRQFLNFDTSPGGIFMGSYTLDNVHMRLSGDYVCSSRYTKEQCDNVLQVCGNPAFSSQPLPTDSCSPAAMQRACDCAKQVLIASEKAGHPRQPGDAGSNKSGTSTSIVTPQLSPPNDGDSGPRSLWWVGLLVGLACVAAIFAAALLTWRYRKRAFPCFGFKGPALPSIACPGHSAAVPTAGLPASQKACMPPSDAAAAASSSPMSSSTACGDTPDLHAISGQSQATAAGAARHMLPSRDGLGSVDPDPRSQVIGSGLAVHTCHPPSQDSVIEYPVGRELLKQAELHQAFMSESTMSDTLTARGSTFMTLPRASATCGIDAPSVVIDMAPLSGPDGLPKLSRNPLGVTLLAVLGTGASGVVYHGIWQRIPVAMKLVRQAVDSQPDLDALLQFREATLGSELQHPRIVRTLAHALVVPEGIMDHGTGTIIRPGTVEAQIVSVLCDMGTLRQWLQTTSRLRAPTSVDVPSLQQCNEPLAGCAQQYPAPSSGNVNINLTSSHQQAAGDDGSNLSWSAQPCGIPSVLSDPDSNLHGHTNAASPEQASLQEGTSGSLFQKDCASGLCQQQRAASSSKEATAKLRAAVAAAVVARDAIPTNDGVPSDCSSSASLDMAAAAAAARGATLGPVNIATTLERGGSFQYQGSTDQLASLYPPLAFMPPWRGTSVRVHSNFNMHLLASVDITLEIVDGLGYLLSKGVVHGDLKPQNVLLCSQANSLRGFTVKICDFGIARVLTGSKSHTTVTHAPGTLCYFAPELLSTCRLSPASDVYSLGIIMYEVLTCKQPLAKLSMAQVLYKKATGAIDEYLTFPEGSPPEYVHLARSCYSLQPTARPTLNTVFEGLMRVRAMLAAPIVVAMQNAPPVPPCSQPSCVIVVPVPEATTTTSTLTPTVSTATAHAEIPPSAV